MKQWVLKNAANRDGPSGHRSACRNNPAKLAATPSLLPFAPAAALPGQPSGGAAHDGSPRPVRELMPRPFRSSSESPHSAGSPPV